MASACVHLLRFASIHPCNHHYQQQTFRKPASLLYVHPPSSLIWASCSFPDPQLITQKYKFQFLSPKIQQNPNFFFASSSTKGTTSTKSTAVCMAALYEANTTASEITPKIPAIEMSILVFVYIIPFLNRLNLLSKFPVLRLAMNPVLAMLQFYQSIPTLGLIGFLASFIGFVRYGRRNLSKRDSVQAMIMDCLVVVASLIRPFLLNTDPLARGAALGFKFQLLNVLELLTFQTCVHACLKYLEAVPWVVARPSIDTLEHIIEVVLKTDGYEGRRAGKSFVVEFLRSRDCLLSDVNSAETYNKNILSSCERCVDSLLKLFKKAADNGFEAGYFCKTLDNQISLEVDNLLWLLDILADRQAAEEFALMWAKQQKLADLYTKFWTPSRHSINCITVRLLVGIGKVEILLTKDTRQLLLLTWFQPLVDDYACLRKRTTSFDLKVAEENIERIILELTPGDQQSVYLRWFGCFLKKGDACPKLLKAFEGWSRRTKHL